MTFIATTLASWELFGGVKRIQRVIPPRPIPAIIQEAGDCASLSEAELLASLDRLVREERRSTVNILRHKFPAGRLPDIFTTALHDLLDRRDPARRLARRQARLDRLAAREIALQL